MKKHTIVLGLIIYSLANFQAYAQHENGSVGVEEVTVNSNYQAELEKANKINSNPLDEDKDIVEKKEINYSIQSFPVASTYVPEKGAAVGLDQKETKNYYPNYASFSVGNYNQIHARLGVAQPINNQWYIGGKLGYSRANGLKEFETTDSGYQNAFLEIALGSKSTKADWQVKAGTNFNQNSWYAVPFEDLELDKKDFETIDLKRTAQYAGVNTKGIFYDQFIESVMVDYARFWDDIGTRENAMYFSPTFTLPIGNQAINFKLQADYVSTSFGENFDTKDHFVFTAEPSIKIQKENFLLSLGAGLGYVKYEDLNEDQASITFYPKVTIDASLVPDIVNAYVGAEGGISTNSYRSLYQNNPYVAMETDLRPTKTAYDLYGGLKGKLYHNISYNIKAGYKRQQNLPLFTLRGGETLKTNQLPYNYANAFDVVYEDVNTLSGFGELTFNFNHLKISAFGAYNMYQLDSEAIAYNLPELKVGLHSGIEFTEKLSTNVELYYVSGRKDIQTITYSDIDIVKKTEKQLNPYVNLKAHMQYQLTDRWSVFVKGNNLLNQRYDLFTNYLQRGVEVYGGISYRF